MNKHIDKAMELRNESPMVSNCSQTILKVYAEELGMDVDAASNLGANFGGGMRIGSTCGVITSAIMVLGMKGYTSPDVAQYVINKIKEKHDGMTNCADLLRANMLAGGVKKTHCDQMIIEAIEIIDEIAK